MSRYREFLTHPEQVELTRLTLKIEACLSELRTLKYCRDLIARRGTARMQYNDAQDRVKKVRAGD